MRALSRSEKRFLDELRSEGWTITEPEPVEVTLFARDTAVGECLVGASDRVTLTIDGKTHEGTLMLAEGPLGARVILDHENFARWVGWHLVTPLTVRVKETA